MVGRQVATGHLSALQCLAFDTATTHISFAGLPLGSVWSPAYVLHHRASLCKTLGTMTGLLSSVAFLQANTPFHIEQDTHLPLDAGLAT